MAKFYKSPLFLIVTVGLIALDLATKLAAKTFFAEPINIFSGVFKLSLSFNTGVAFSIPVPNTLMILLSPILIGLLIYFIAKSCDTNSRITQIALSLMAAGGLGNFINRLWTGAVIDFIDFSFWPSFNFADMYLTISAFILLAFYGKITITKYERPK